MIRKLLPWSIALLALLSAGAAAWYELVYIPPRFSPAAPEAVAALDGTATVEVTRDKWIVMRPRDRAPVAGLIFYPGGEVDPVGYAEPLRDIAAAGYLVVNVPMPLDLAILAPERADAVMAAYPTIRTWVIAGHSLGGSMAARYAFRHPDRVAGLLLWDAYPADTDDLSSRRTPVRQLYRLDPDGQVPAKYQQTAGLLPSNTEIVPLPGASHINYGRFVAARRFQDSPPATIPIELQHRQIVSASIAFLDRLTAAGDGSEAGVMSTRQQP